MIDDPDGSLAARVLTAIERHPEGLPLEDLRERLRRNGRRPAAEAVAAALLDLQRADLTHIGTRRRWFPHRLPPPPAVRPRWTMRRIVVFLIWIERHQSTVKS